MTFESTFFLVSSSTKDDHVPFSHSDSDELFRSRVSIKQPVVLTRHGLTALVLGYVLQSLERFKSSLVSILSFFSFIEFARKDEGCAWRGDSEKSVGRSAGAASGQDVCHRNWPVERFGRRDACAFGLHFSDGVVHYFLR